MNLESIKARAAKIGAAAWKYRSIIFGAASSILVRLIPLPDTIDEDVKGHIYRSMSSVLATSFDVVTSEGPLTQGNKVSMAISMGTAFVLVGMLAVGTSPASIGATMSAIGIAVMMYRLKGYLATMRTTLKTA